ncbi:MAG: flavodoxin family protein [Planctomycetaceae bacterium]|nr:flavodoxin family protein [Planctomycetaceae bacterium]
MKILAILGSPRGDKSNTAMLLDAAIASARNAGAEVTRLSLATMKVQPCCGCERCHEIGACGIRDDFAAVRTALDEANGIILASPNYMRGVTAQLKALMDRCSAAVHCQTMTAKYAAAIVTSGGPQSKEVEDFILNFAQAVGCWTVGSASAAAYELHDGAQRPARLQAAADLGKRLVECVANRTIFPEQAAGRRAFAQRMRELVTSRREDWAYEYKYWQAMGPA